MDVYYITVTCYNLSFIEFLPIYNLYKFCIKLLLSHYWLWPKVGESGLGRGTGGSGRFGGGPGAGCRSRFGANNSSNNNNSNIADQLVNIACGRMPKFIFFRRIQYSGTFSTGRYPISVFVSVIFILKLRPPPSTSPQTARHALPTLLG